jgi:uncharacterized protein (DUF2141 family)
MTLRDLTRAASSAAGLTLALGLAAPAISLAQVRSDGATVLRVEVSSFRNAKGTLNCRLFTEASGFPDGDGARTLRVAIAGTQATCVFDDLPPGTYAVAVVHDENGNGQLDKNFLGIPSEGYGVSNNRTYAVTAKSMREFGLQMTGGSSSL